MRFITQNLVFLTVTRHPSQRACGSCDGFRRGQGAIATVLRGEVTADEIVRQLVEKYRAAKGSHDTAPFPVDKQVCFVYNKETK
jgi:hypothetical protein